MGLSSFGHSVVPGWKSVFFFFRACMFYTKAFPLASSDQLVYELQFISEELNSYIGFELDKKNPISVGVRCVYNKRGF